MDSIVIAKMVQSILVLGLTEITQPRLKDVPIFCYLWVNAAVDVLMYTQFDITIGIFVIVLFVDLAIPGLYFIHRLCDEARVNNWWELSSDHVIIELNNNLLRLHE